MKTTLTKNLILIMFFFLVYEVSAQDKDPFSSTEEALNSRKVKKTVFFNYNSSKASLAFTTDEPFTTAKSTPFPNVLYLSSMDGNVNLMLNFLNPVKFSITTSESLSKDPQVENGNQFVRAITDILNLINPQGLPIPTVPAAGKGIDDLLEESFVKGDTVDKVKLNELLEFIKSESVVELALQLINGTTKSCLSAEKKVAYLKKISTTDQGFYQFQDDAKKLLNRMGSISKIEELDGQLASLKQDVKNLELLNTSTIKEISELVELDKKLNWGKDGECVILQRYCTAKIKAYSQNVDQISNARKEAVKFFELLTAKFDDIKVNADEEAFLLKNVAIDAGSIQNVKITITENDVTFDNTRINVTKKTENVYTLKIRNYTRVILEFGSGILFTSLSYPQYGTSTIDGKTVISDAGDKKVDFALASMLNLVFNTGRSFVQPMIQLGVGTGKSIPMVFFGVGGRLLKPINHLSISLGPVFGFKQKLQELHLGDVVTGTADIQKDLKFKFDKKPSIYFGLQYSF